MDDGISPSTLDAAHSAAHQKAVAWVRVGMILVAAGEIRQASEAYVQAQHWVEKMREIEAAASLLP
jgi:hypothetical protein